MIVFQNGRRFTEHKYATEAEFEADVVGSRPALFGSDTIYVDAKRKIGTAALGATIPDGFLFNMSDPDNRELYLVEVELERHDFYRHIFPQITKFFAFFRNSQRQRELVQKLFTVINSDPELRAQFKRHLGDREIFKFLSDLIDASQNILIVIDGQKPELPEITDTYSDTWGKMVKVLTVKRFDADGECVFTVDPEFETIEEAIPGEDTGVDGPPGEPYTEEFHLEGVNENVRQIYAHIKRRVAEIDPSFQMNFRKGYISIRGRRNIAFIRTRKKKIRLVIMLPEEEIRARAQHHKVIHLTDSVRNFYNGPCAKVDIDSLDHIEEIIDLLKTLMGHDEDAETAADASATP